MKWHEEVLDQAGHAAARRLAPLAADFYLAGGTALALRLGHRISLDLDLFSAHNALHLAERRSLLGALAGSGPLEILEEKDGTCHLDVGGTAVSLFHYDYPMLRPAERWNGLALASIEDIAAMKLSAVLGRGSKKDFIDLYELCGRVGLERIMKSAARKFSKHRDFPLQAVRALVYFKDADREPMPKILAPISWEDIKVYFEEAVPRYTRSYLKS